MKKQIKDWHSAISQRKNQDWLIVHVVRSDIKTTDRKFFNMKSSVLDKIKADFNMDKRDRYNFSHVVFLLAYILQMRTVVLDSRRPQSCNMG